MPRHSRRHDLAARCASARSQAWDLIARRGSWRRGPLALAAVVALSVPVACSLPERSDDVPPTCESNQGGSGLRGYAVVSPSGPARVEIAPVTARDGRRGTLALMRIGARQLPVRAETPGGPFERERRGTSGTPIAALAGASPAIQAYDVTYRTAGADTAAAVVIGTTSPPAALPETGQATFSGPVRFTIADLATGGAPVEATGTLTAVAGYGSQMMDIRVTGLPASAPFSEVAWSRLALCGVRIGSAGQGGFVLKDAEGRRTNFAGASAAGQGSAAQVSSFFYGGSREAGQPDAIGGVILVAGDSGVVSGVFAASRR